MGQEVEGYGRTPAAGGAGGAGVQEEQGCARRCRGVPGGAGVQEEQG